MTMLPEFANLLKQTMGLDAASIGDSAIERAVQERQSACKLKDTQAYWEHVLTCDAELQELVESVVVPETWFFRDREAFATLARMACEQWLPAHAQGALRVLSLPCATGEEPYSIAMALLDAGFPADRFWIDAVDISVRALAQAGRAVYGRNSFRGNELAFRDRHFEPSGQGYRLHDAVRRPVHFQHGNLFGPDFLPGAAIYDAIFCRNVLIYFDRAEQDRAIKVLDRLLTAKGMLFVAPAETGLLLDHDFVSAKVPLAFAFLRRPPKLAQARPVSVQPPRTPMPARSKAPAPMPRPVHKHADARTRPVAAAPGPTVAATPAGELDAAMRLADQGLLVEAAKRCEEYLHRHGPSAAAFYLLGLVRDTSGMFSEAALYYRKALYLDPQHQEALLHLALLQEQQGNDAGARLLHNRRERLADKSRH